MTKDDLLLLFNILILRFCDLTHDMRWRIMKICRFKINDF